MYITQELAVKLNYFLTKEGQAALKALADAMYIEYATQCTRIGGDELYRFQGKAQVAEFLQKLPEGIANAANGPTTKRMGQSPEPIL